MDNILNNTIIEFNAGINNINCLCILHEKKQKKNFFQYLLVFSLVAILQFQQPSLDHF